MRKGKEERNWNEKKGDRMQQYSVLQGKYVN